MERDDDTWQALRPHERACDAALRADASLAFIGRIRTPWPDRDACPRQGDPDGPECRIELASPWDAALDGIEAYLWVEALYWLDRARRDLLLQNPSRGGTARGTFSLRSPIRPNPIGTALVRLIRREGPVLVVRGLDCIDGTPLIDLKPDRCRFSPAAARSAGITPAPGE
jgi:tRNA-Thr(GGU) m(6)t(6)A37 methyltransferase TsaA